MKSVVFAIVALICVVHLKGIAADDWDFDDGYYGSVNPGYYRSVNQMAYPVHYPVAAPVSSYYTAPVSGYGAAGVSAGGVGGVNNNFNTQFLTLMFLLPVLLSILNQNRNNNSG